MKKLKLLTLSFIFLLIPALSLGATGHINGCTNTTFDTNCCTKTFKITAQSGYTVTDVIVNGVSQGAITSYTFSNISGPQTLKVITTSNGSGGSTGGSTGGTSGGTSTGDSTSSGGPYTIRFNANGGTGTMANQTYTAGVEQTLPASTFTKTGFSFGGWALTAGGLKVYTDGDYYIATQNQILYAVWEKDFAIIKDDGIDFVSPGANYTVTANNHIVRIYFNGNPVVTESGSVSRTSATKVTASYSCPVAGDMWQEIKTSWSGSCYNYCDCEGDDYCYERYTTSVYLYTYRPEN